MPRGRPKGTKNKVRVSKKEVRDIIEKNKITSYKSKKTIIPGPWTNRDTKLKVKVSLRKTSGVTSDILGEAYGKYTDNGDILPKGWYPIVFNIECKNIAKIIDENGMDDFLAACEKYLTEQTDKSGKTKYGTLIITEMCIDNSKSKGFVSVRARTNKKSISGFRAVRKNVMVVLP